MRLLLLSALAAAVAAVSPSRRTVEPPGRLERTTWDSVYTAAQAAHGDTLYHATCTKCHGPTLGGGDDGGPLVGPNFLANWNGLAMDQLFDKIYTTMPSDKPKSLPRQDYADILAYMLSQNQFPAGAAVLSDSSELLRDIKIVASKP